MTEREKLIRTIENRLNESRNKKGAAVTVAKSTLRSMKKMLKQEQPKFAVKNEKNEYWDIELICPDCNATWISYEKNGEWRANFCPVCGRPVKVRPTFSVIVPAYNAADHIRKGLESIRGQIFRDYELIVICDACTDNTVEIAREYTDKVFECDFHRDGLARNVGIDAAIGDWILFMDDDDWFKNDRAFGKIAIGTEKCEEADILMFGFDMAGVGYRQQLSGSSRVTAVWSKCWKREFIGKTRFSDKAYWSDADFDEEMFSKRPVLKVLDEPLYYYNYLRPGSITWRQQQGEIKQESQEEHE